MSSNDDENTTTNIINFGRRTGRTGFSLTPAPPTPGTGALGPVVPPQPPTPPETGTVTRTRRSPLDTLNALPSPTLTAPPVVATASPEPGLPDTFRNDDGTAGPQIGALSMAAVLAVAITALRGTHTFLEDRRQRRMAREAEEAPMREARLKHRLAMAQHGYGAEEAAAKGQVDLQKARDKTNAQSAKKNQVPSSAEYGRKTLNRSSGGGSGSSAGSSKKPSATRSPSTGAGTRGQDRGGSKKTSTPNSSGGTTSSKKNRTNGVGGTGLGGSSSKKSKGSDTGRKTNSQHKSPHRGSQGAGSTLAKNGNGSTNSGGRTRKERAAARQDGRLQRRADRQKARLKEDAKDRAAARDHKYAPKKARQDRKNRIRDARANAMEARREQDRQKKFDAKQNERAQKADAKRLKKAEARAAKAAADAGRTKLWDAIKQDTASTLGDRWAKRNGVPPLWKSDKKREKKTDKAKSEESGTDNPKVKDWRQKARDRAHKAWDDFAARSRPGDPEGCFDGTVPPTNGPTNADTNSAGPGEDGPRRSPFGNASATTAADATDWTVERNDQPTAPHGDPDQLGTGQAGLPAAPDPHTERPGTTRPREPISMPSARSPRQTRTGKEHPPVTPERPNGNNLDPEYATEITLDDALDELGDLREDAFATHSRCNLLAARARKLRDTLEQLAIELRTKHNVWGRLFGAAMYRLMESMEVLALAADEMETRSLNAAEKCEAADNDLNDAYRPISQATADAGLTTPSAPIHNYA